MVLEAKLCLFLNTNGGFFMHKLSSNFLWFQWYHYFVLIKLNEALCLFSTSLQQETFSTFRPIYMSTWKSSVQQLWRWKLQFSYCQISDFRTTREYWVFVILRGGGRKWFMGCSEKPISLIQYFGNLIYQIIFSLSMEISPEGNSSSRNRHWGA